MSLQQHALLGKRRGASDLSSEEGWRLFKIDKEYLLKMAAEE